MARRGRTWRIAGALLALPLLAAAPALAEHQDRGAGQGNSAAYPEAPGGTPAATDKGKPVQPAADPAAKPGASGKASTEGADQKVGTPSTAYPGAPGGTPAAGDAGKPVEPKP